MSESGLGDAAIMARAIEIAGRGAYTARPNPCVGCVIAKEGAILAEGWHRAKGEDHAEVRAIRALGGGAPADGLELFVTLEPCSHRGATPPCTEAILRLRPARVVVAARDPNPLVDGKGIAALRDADIPVEVGLRQEEALWLNRGHAKRMTTGRPWVTVKAAATLDGKTALESGLSRWITGEQARADVQRTRAASCAILTGIGTALQDNPRLTVREVQVDRQPLRVLVDSGLRSNPEMEIFSGGATLLACAREPDARLRYGQETQIVALPDAEGKVDLEGLLNLLGERECNSVLVEAGARLNGALLQRGLVDEIQLYMAPVVFGKGRQLFDMAPPATPAEAVRLELRGVEQIGGDVKATFVAARG